MKPHDEALVYYQSKLSFELQEYEFFDIRSAYYMATKNHEKQEVS